MLARIAHELYWLGRNLTRAEITSRVVDGTFQVELQGASASAPGVVLGWSELLAMLGDTDEQGAPTAPRRSSGSRSTRTRRRRCAPPSSGRERARARCAT